MLFDKLLCNSAKTTTRLVFLKKKLNILKKFLILKSGQEVAVSEQLVLPLLVSTLAFEKCHRKIMFTP